MLALITLMSIEVRSADLVPYYENLSIDIELNPGAEDPTDHLGGTGLLIRKSKTPDTLYFLTAKHTITGFDQFVEDVDTAIVSMSIFRPERIELLRTRWKKVKSIARFRYSELDQCIVAIPVDRLLNAQVAERQQVINISVPLSTLVLGRSPALRLGTEVYWFGSPISLSIRPEMPGMLLRSGRVSGLFPNRPRAVLDIRAYPGDSGSPIIMVNKNGEHKIIGILVETTLVNMQYYSALTIMEYIDSELFR